MKMFLWVCKSKPSAPTKELRTMVSKTIIDIVKLKQVYPNIYKVLRREILEGERNEDAFPNKHSIGYTIIN